MDIERLEALGKSLCKTRDEAISARLASGIETIWLEDEEHYEGVDDQNRGYGRTAWQSKPPGRADPRSRDVRSIVFPNISRPYVDAAAAKIGDTLLPTDDRAWSLGPTPLPELVDMALGKLPDEAARGMEQAGVPPEAQQQVQQIETAEAQKKIKDAVERARKAEKRIEDWHVEGQFHAEMRRVIDDFCRIGTGILKGPVPEVKKTRAFVDGAIIVREEIKPVSKRVDPWNFYPAAGCGESIHDGNYCWERDFITKKALSELIGQGYIDENIKACLEEGPKKAGSTRKTTDGRDVDDGELYEIWYGYTFAEAEDMAAAGCECEEGMQIPALVTVVNDHVIKVALNPLESGEFPYDLMPYQRRIGMPWGTGVSRQIRTPQQMLTAAVRTMLTNAGRAAGPMMVFKNNVVPADGTNDLTPWKVYYASDDDSTDDARKLVSMIAIPDMQASLMNIVQFAMKLAEDVTGLPLLLQGQAGSAPETLGGQQLVDRNASAVLRRVARTVDDCITEPHIRRYYDWLLQYGEDDEKGDYVIDARGSTSLVDKDMYKQELQQLLQAALNPAFELSPPKIMAEIMRMNRRSPDDFRMTDDEKQAMQQSQQKPEKQDNSVQVAQIRQSTEMEKAKLNQASDMEELKFKAQEADKQRAHDMSMRQMERDIEIMKVAQARNISIEKVKADLAKTAMTLRVQKEMGGTNVAEPKVEPRGVAPSGQAFQK